MGLGLAGKDQGWRSSRLTVAMERISPAEDGAGRARRPGRDRSPRPDGQVRSAGFLAAVVLVTLHAAMPRRTASERLAARPSVTSTSRAASSRLSSRMAICVLMVLPADAKRQPNGMQPFLPSVKAILDTSVMIATDVLLWRANCASARDTAEEPNSVAQKPFVGGGMTGDLTRQ